VGRAACYAPWVTTAQLLAFDLMDTVAADPFLPSLGQLAGADLEALRDCLDSAAWVEFELGLIDEPAFVARLFRHPPPRPELAARSLCDAILAGYAFVDGMEALLGELRDAGVRLWVLSNYPSWAERVRQQLDLDRFFEGYAFSYRTGARKPDAAAYRELCRLAGVAAERCLLVDDRLANLEGARRVGMPGLHFRGSASLRGQLGALGLLPAR
jgi:FMN hydrolase / 5-amino-6-(5-phospho-D-ribitylamino)uracil phosphatase